MGLKKQTNPSLKELFVTEIENQILSGKLKIGSKLPTERELASKMQVSRAVVNSGISEMANKGFLEIHSRKGTYVSDYRRTGTTETLISLMKYNGGKLKKEEILSIIELRMIMDRLSAVKVIDKDCPSDIVLLRNYSQKIKNSSSSNEAAINAFNFIHEFYVLSNNILFPLITYSFKEPITSLWIRFCNNYGIDALYEDMEMLLNYIEKKDKQGAIEHIQSIMNESIYGTRQIYSD